MVAKRISLAGIVVAALIAAAVDAPRADAHASFLGSTPTPGQRVQRSPRQITLRFTEALNGELSKANVVDLRTGATIAAKVVAGPRDDLLLRPERALASAAYRVDWFSVSADDGHAESGSVGFGVRAPAIGSSQVTERSPLARDGALRIALRAVFYASLFFFAGGVFTSLLLSGAGGLGRWLVPEEVGSELAASGEDSEAKARVIRRRTIDAGRLAAAAAAVVAIADAADAADAAGGLGPKGLNDYLLTNTAGLARVASVVALVLAALAARRRPRIAAIGCVAAFAAIAFSGHANSASPRALALLTDWIHLIAAAVWVGGIGQIAVTWALPAIRGDSKLRRAVMNGVLARFGPVALWAFAVVIVSGLANALIELGHPAALWESGYGRALAVKIGLVGLVAAFSYLHALRLRPRLLAANPHPDPQLEHQHWRLLRAEPAIVMGVVLAAAVLVAFPLPPRQLAASGDAIAGGATCSPCPLATAGEDQLPVAGHVGPAIAAVWLRKTDQGLSGRLRLLGIDLDPVDGQPSISGAALTDCGPGCWDFELGRRPRTIVVHATIAGHPYTTRLPARWRSGPGANRRARQLLVGAQNAMNKLRSVQQHERITSGPGSLAVTDYRLQAPNRFSYSTNSGARSVTVGGLSWQRSSATHGRWHRGRYTGGGPPFITRTWFRFTPYAQAVRLLGVRRESGQRIAEIALFDQATPAWWRLRIDLGSMRVPTSGLIAAGHFMTEHYHGFNQPLRIAAPAASGG
jgi:copper transport protein